MTKRQSARFPRGAWGWMFMLFFPVLCAAQPSPSFVPPPGARESLDAAVQKKAEGLVSEGFTAGSVYGEVWIRDLNTFMALSCHVNDRRVVKKNLLLFFELQQPNGEIVDGFSPKGRSDEYAHYLSALAPEVQGHKNTVETDQESSLVQAVAVYIRSTGDTSILNEQVGKYSVRERLALALKFPLDQKMVPSYGLLWGATRADWGDVQPESEWGVVLDGSTHRALSIYDNAMFLLAIQDYLAVAEPPPAERRFWNTQRKSLQKNIMAHLWDSKRQKFIPHIYLNGSPFPAEFDENAIYYHGGTTVAIEAGLLTKPQVLAAYKKMAENVKQSGAATIGLTVYPPYPAGSFRNPAMGPYSYQNGGDWTWFGARMVTQLARYGFRAEARAALAPMLERVIRNDGFYEWYTRDNRPAGSASFRGEAGVLWTAINAVNAETKKPVSALHE